MGRSTIDRVALQRLPWQRPGKIRDPGESGKRANGMTPMLLRRIRDGASAGMPDRSCARRTRWRTRAHQALPANSPVVVLTTIFSPVLMYSGT